MLNISLLLSHYPSVNPYLLRNKIIRHQKERIPNLLFFAIGV